MDWVKAYGIFQQEEILDGFGNGFLDTTPKTQVRKENR